MKKTIADIDTLGSSRHNPELALDRALAGLKTPHHEKISGSRPTFFTALSTTSFKSIQNKRPELNSYFALRVVPPSIILEEYEPGVKYTLSFKIKNCSKKAEYVTLSATQTTLFHLDKSVPMGEFMVAPGLEKVIQVVFYAPPLPDASNAKTGSKESLLDPTLKLYMDRISIQSRNNHKILVPFEAYPCRPRLECETLVDLGIMVQSYTAMDILQKIEVPNDLPDKKTRLTSRRSIAVAIPDTVSPQERLKEQRKALDDLPEWSRRQVLVVNTGRRTAEFTCSFDKSLPIKVKPSKFSLSGEASVDKEGHPTSCVLTIEYLPVAIGNLNTAIDILSTKDWPLPKDTPNNSNISLKLTGLVIDHPLQLKGLTCQDKSKAELSFGTVYFNQKIKKLVKISNCGPHAQKWTIEHDIDSVPRVRGQDNEDDSAEQRAAMSVVPAEGILGVGESVTVQVGFYPILPPKTVGFKTNRAPAIAKNYKTHMQIKLFTVTGQSLVHLKAIDLYLLGKSVPIIPKLSHEIVRFPSVHSDQHLQMTATLSNEGSLPFQFHFGQLIHFKVIPNYGIIEAGAKEDIVIVFCPRQLGQFSENVTCSISPVSDKLSDPILNLSKLPLVLTGASLPTEGRVNVNYEVNLLTDDPSGDIHPKWSPRSPKIFTSYSPTASRLLISEDDVKRTRQEWDTKINHRDRYISYLRSARHDRMATSRDTYFDNDGVVTDLSELPVMKLMDKENGLIPPVVPTVALPSKSQVSTPAAKGTFEGDKKRLNALFQKLNSSFVEIPKVLNEIKGPLVKVLDSSELGNIYAPTIELDFGTVTVHSINSIPLNLLNANPNTPVYIELVQDQVIKKCLTISPTSQVIHPMTVAGFKLVLQQDVSGPIELPLVYFVNTRHRYHLKVKAHVLPVAIQASATSILVDVNVSSNTRLRTTSQGDWIVHNGDDHPADEVSAMRSFVAHGKSQVPLGEQTMKLFNPGNYGASFEWSQPPQEPGNELSEGVVKIFPLQGSVPPKGSVEVRFQYSAGIKPVLERQLKLQVFDDFNGHHLAHTVDVAFRGQITATSCTLLTTTKQGPLDFGILPLFGTYDFKETNQWTLANFYSPTLTHLSKNSGSKTAIKGVKTIKLKNPSVSSCIFLASLAVDSSDIDIRPRTGIIAGGGGIIDLTVHVLPTKTGLVENSVIIHIIGGGRTFKVQFKYEGRVPAIECHEIGSDLSKGVIVGSSLGNLYEILNTGTAYCRMILDMRPFPCFKAALISVGDHYNGASKSPKPHSSARNKRGDTRSELTSPNYSFRAVTAQDDFHSIPAPHSSSVDNASCYVVDIFPGDKVTLAINYHPTATGNASLNLPIRVLGSSEPLSEIKINCKALSSPININQNLITFKNKVINGSIAFTNIKASKETLSFKNVINVPIEWDASLVYANNPLGVFWLEPETGVLNPGETQEVSLLFMPEFPGAYESTVSLSLSYSGLSASFSVPISGNGIEPSLAFDPPEVFLPISPVGLESTVIFSVINYGCERTEVKHSLSIELQNHDGTMEILFPEGKLLKADGEKLTCMIRMITGQAKTGKARSANVSFVAKLILGDSTRKQFYLPIHGTTDCSPLTLFPFLWMTQSEYTLKTRLNPLSITYELIDPPEVSNDHHKRLKILNGPRPFKSPAGIPLDGSVNLRDYEDQLTRMGETLALWLEDHTGSSSCWKAFPSGFVANAGKAVVDMLHSIAGKKIAGISSNMGLSLPIEERVKYTYRQYVDIINHLSSIGASVSAIKGEFLLSIEEFKKHIHHRLESVRNEMGSSGQSSYIRYFAAIETHFQIISKEAWFSLIVQIFRVYVLKPITVRHLKQLPGLPHQNYETLLPKSNVYGVPEQVLLAWSTAHYRKRTDTQKALTNLSTDFNDSVAIIQLVLSHLPHLAANFKNSILTQSTESRDQKLENASILLNLFKEVYVSSAYVANMVPTDIVDGTQIDFLLLLTFLYQTLPLSIPKGAADFHGYLHEKVSRTIELVNPSNVPLAYTMQVSGATEFVLTESTCIVPAKSQAFVEVEFTSQFSRPVQGLLTMKTKRMGFNISSYVVYQLSATVEPATPLKLIKIDSPLYCVPPVLANVEVTNPFSTKATFSIHIRHKRKLTVQEERSLTRMDNLSPPAFKLEKEEITLGPNQTLPLFVQFLPFDHGLHDCLIFFYDKSVGEFMYKIEGRAILPTPIESFIWTCKAGGTMEKAIRIGPTNPVRDKALYAAVNPGQYKGSNAVHGKKRGKERNLSAGAIERESYQLPRRPLRYRVEYSSTFFKGPSDVILKSLQPEGRLLSIDQSHTELPIHFSPTAPGKYTCKVVLNCLETSDVRTFVIHGMARSEGSRAELLFGIAARQIAIQEIPIINRTDDDWSIKASLQGMQFVSPYSIIVKPQTIGQFPVTFKPSKACEVEGALSLTNSQTSQKYTYHLKGVATDPLPEETRDLIIEARQYVDQTFPVKNTSDKDVTFTVETDLPLAQGEKTIRVAANDSKDYVCTMYGRCSSSAPSVIRFINKSDDSFLWYSMNLEVRRARAESKLTLSALIRDSVAVEVPIENPLNERVTYSISWKGDFLSGDKQVILEPKSRKLYSLFYSPLLPVKSEGAVIFQNEDVGEFWYELQLEGKHGLDIELSPMSCPLGKCSLQPFTYENPLNEELVIEVILTNSRDFQVQYPAVEKPSEISRRNAPMIKLALKPLQTAVFQLVFWPCSLTESRSTQIDIVCPQVGTSHYFTTGVGQLPEPMEPIEITTKINEIIATGLVTFVNPFIDPVPISITFTETDPSHDISLVLSRRTKISIGGLERFDIPFTYAPTSLVKATGRVEIEVNPQLKWVYDIKGIPSDIVTGTNYELVSKVRESNVKEFEVTLQGLSGTISDSNDVSSAFTGGIESSLPDPSSITKCLGFELKSFARVGLDSVKVKLMAVFSPNRLMDTTVFFLITHQGAYGQWKFPVRLLSTPPMPQETVTIEGSLLRTTNINLLIPRPLETRTKYRAFFTEDTPGDLTVSPERGYLVPDSLRTNEDNVLVITFKANGLGKSVVGTLVVETTETTTSYEVRGVTPLTKSSMTLFKSSNGNLAFNRSNGNLASKRALSLSTRSLTKQ